MKMRHLFTKAQVYNEPAAYQTHPTATFYQKKKKNPLKHFHTARMRALNFKQNATHVAEFYLKSNVVND
jgi:hypothetical protein